MDSPCIRHCTLDTATKICVGCGRHLDEIAAWTGLTDDDRRRIMAELPARLIQSRTRADVEPSL